MHRGSSTRRRHSCCAGAFVHNKRMTVQQAPRNLCSTSNTEVFLFSLPSLLQRSCCILHRRPCSRRIAARCCCCCCGWTPHPTSRHRSKSCPLSWEEKQEKAGRRRRRKGQGEHKNNKHSIVVSTSTIQPGHVWGVQHRSACRK